jgi:hypothetical protein
MEKTRKVLSRRENTYKKPIFHVSYLHVNALFRTACGSFNTWQIRSCQQHKRNKEMLEQQTMHIAFITGKESVQTAHCNSQPQTQPRIQAAQQMQHDAAQPLQNMGSEE